MYHFNTKPYPVLSNNDLPFNFDTSLPAVPMDVEQEWSDVLGEEFYTPLSNSGSDSDSDCTTLPASELESQRPPSPWSDSLSISSGSDFSRESTLSPIPQWPMPSTELMCARLAPPSVNMTNTLAAYPNAQLFPSFPRDGGACMSSKQTQMFPSPVEQKIPAMPLPALTMPPCIQATPATHIKTATRKRPRAIIAPNNSPLILPPQEPQPPVLPPPKRTKRGSAKAHHKTRKNNCVRRAFVTGRVCGGAKDSSGLCDKCKSEARVGERYTLTPEQMVMLKVGSIPKSHDNVTGTRPKLNDLPFRIPSVNENKRVSLYAVLDASTKLEVEKAATTKKGKCNKKNIVQVPCNLVWELIKTTKGVYKFVHKTVHKPTWAS